ncbi:putative Cyanovirin-N domain-containing protein [Seiridium unicorne]|uniref:Cyanovirin-N domain-containing protein n=1 Tax=Seiridium unicorne TaxID=138068 RepID=A0ABR2UM29_9PEZI
MPAEDGVGSQAMDAWAKFNRGRRTARYIVSGEEDWIDVRRRLVGEALLRGGASCSFLPRRVEKIMKLVDLILVASLVASASAGSQLRRGTSSTSGCCKFTLTASAPFSCPAGQLPDGQIHLNGSQPTSTFCIDQGGKITDQNGYGCIVTGETATTQSRDALFLMPL